MITCAPYGDDSGAFIIVDADTADTADTAATVRQVLTENPFVVHGLVPAQRIVQRTRFSEPCG
ncbi:hypothetical protein [Rhodococcus sp. NPDC057529]|uniref:hypothetical protein n=1 Tax=Rhodococcus sp. NPDC057529 TaxID=3346158 RepID=UPI003673309C